MDLCTEWFDVFGGIAKTTLKSAHLLVVLCRAQRAVTLTVKFMTEWTR